MKTIILVAAHKEYPMPADSLYLPIHVGKAISTVSLPFMGDNTGDHISEKNPYYCELTALYFAWKNIEADYIGLAHYRRHFAFNKPLFPKKDKFPYILTESQASFLLKDFDILLPKKRNYFIETGYSQYVHSHPEEPLLKTKELIQTLYPDYIPAFEQVMHSTKAHRFNMFVMKKEILDDYCSWLFSILFALEKELDISSYDTYNKRVYGFLSERLLDVYLVKNNLSYKELPVLFMEQEHWFKKIYAFLKRKFFR